MRHAVNARWRSIADEEPTSAPAWLLRVVQALRGSAATSRSLLLATFAKESARACTSFITYRVVRYYKLPRNYKGVIACVTETLNTHRSRKSSPPRGTRAKHRTLRTFLLVPAFSCRSTSPSLPSRETILIILPAVRNHVRPFHGIRIRNESRPRIACN